MSWNVGWTWHLKVLPHSSMDSASCTRLWVGPDLQWGPGTTPPKVQPRCSLPSSLLSLPYNFT